MSADYLIQEDNNSIKRCEGDLYKDVMYLSSFMKSISEGSNETIRDRYNINTMAKLLEMKELLNQKILSKLQRICC